MERILSMVGELGLGRFSLRRSVSLVLGIALSAVSLSWFAMLLVHAGPQVRWTTILPLYGVAMSSLWIWSDLFEWDPPAGA